MPIFCRLMSRLGYTHKGRLLVALRERDEARDLARDDAEKLRATKLDLAVALQERDDAVAECDRYRSSIRGLAEAMR